MLAGDASAARVEGLGRRDCVGTSGRADRSSARRTRRRLKRVSADARARESESSEGSGQLRRSLGQGADGAELAVEFYDRPVVGGRSRPVGCSLTVDGVGGIITETEAYHVSEAACHAYVGLTKRTAPLYGPPGKRLRLPLLRRPQPAERSGRAQRRGCGRPHSSARAAGRPGADAKAPRNGSRADALLRAGQLTQALGIGLELNEAPLVGGHFEIRERADGWDSEVVGVAPRIGSRGRSSCEWRFCEEGSRYLSRPIPARAAS